MKMWDKFRANRYKFFIDAKADVTGEQRGSGPLEVHLTFRVPGKKLPVILSVPEAFALGKSLVNIAQVYLEDFDGTQPR